MRERVREGRRKIDYRALYLFLFFLGFSLLSLLFSLIVRFEAGKCAGRVDRRAATGAAGDYDALRSHGRLLSTKFYTRLYFSRSSAGGRLLPSPFSPYFPFRVGPCR